MPPSPMRRPWMGAGRAGPLRLSIAPGWRGWCTKTLLVPAKIRAVSFSAPIEANQQLVKKRTGGTPVPLEQKIKGVFNDRNLHHSGNRGRPAARGGGDLQQTGDQQEPGGRGLERHRRPAQAPGRPDSQPDRDGEGLHGPRAGRPGEGHRTAGPEPDGHGRGRQGQGGRGPGGGPGQPLRGGGKLSRFEGQPEFFGVAKSPGRHRGPDPTGPALLQRRRPQLQYPDPVFSQQPSGRYL
jgi:hypothetical protein